MKRGLFTIIAICASISIYAQLNVQFHYDFGSHIYGDELSNRSNLTATIENFAADKWGSTYFFIDANLGNNTMENVYAEFSRELRFWEPPLAIHLEYNGGLSGAGSYNDAYLLGCAYNWANKDFSRTFSLQLLYRYLARQVVGTKHAWQVTTVWGMHFAKGLYSFSGYADVSYDESVNGSIVVSSEPQFWFNLAALESIDDDLGLSIGAELEISNNLVWPTDGKNNRFYAIPTLAAKWTF